MRTPIKEIKLAEKRLRERVQKEQYIMTRYEKLLSEDMKDPEIRRKA